MLPYNYSVFGEIVIWKVVDKSGPIQTTFNSVRPWTKATSQGEFRQDLSKVMTYIG